MNDEQLKWFESVQALEQKSQEQYDRTVIYLSGGALGISFTFVEKFIGESGAHWKVCLLSAWAVWGLSVTAALASFYFSALALRETAEAVSAGLKWPAAKSRFDSWTGFLNALSGVLFLGGVIMIIIFVALNLQGVTQETR